MRVELTKPAPKTIDFGHDVLFPTQHIERLIEAAKQRRRSNRGAASTMAPTLAQKFTRPWRWSGKKQEAE